MQWFTWACLHRSIPPLLWDIYELISPDSLYLLFCYCIDCYYCFFAYVICLYWFCIPWLLTRIFTTRSATAVVLVCLFLFIFFFVFQVATALLVAGSTLTFWIPPWHLPARTHASFKVLGCSYNCRQLTNGSFQLAHMSCDDTLFNWSSHGSQNKDKTLLQHLQCCHKGEFRHVSISAWQWWVTMWTESSWAFPESYTANDSWIVCLSNGDQRKDKSAHYTPLRWVSAHYTFWVSAQWQSRRSRWCSQNLRRPFQQAVRFD